MLLGRLLAKLRPKVPTLWYENDDGVRWVPPQGGETPPEGYIYQWSQFPNEVHDRCLRAVLRSEVDACEHPAEYVKRTGGWIDGVKGRECQLCNGTQVCDEDEEWPEEWDAEGSRTLMRGTCPYPSDLVMAMLRPSLVEMARQIYRFGLPAVRYYDFNQAVLHAKTMCERCMNAMAYRHGLTWGYPWKSDDWHKAGTSCELCDPDRVKEHDPHDDLC